MSTLFTVALFSGLFQALGYLVYIQKSLRKEVAKPGQSQEKVRAEIEPNPTTWLMFAYGTATLAVLEWDHNADWTILILPVTCAVLSLRVAYICWSQGKLKWPDNWMDVAAFMIDVSLTIAYIAVWVASQKAYISDAQRNELVLLFLVLSNSSTTVSFIPLIRGTLKDPRTEHPLPWFIWTCAYLCLGFVTASQYGYASMFMIYPVMNCILHATMSLCASRRFFR